MATRKQTLWRHVRDSALDAMQRASARTRGSEIPTHDDPVVDWVCRLNATAHCAVLEVAREGTLVRLRVADPRNGREGVLTYHLSADGALTVDPRDFYRETRPRNTKARRHAAPLDVSAA